MNRHLGKTAGNIRAGLSNNLAVWSYLRDSDQRFSITEFVRSPGGRFVFLQSRSDMHAMMRPLISLWLELAGTAQLALSTQRPGHRMFFVIDELPGLQKLEVISKLMAEGRKYDAAIVTGIQLVSQLYRTYGKEAGETMLGLHYTLEIGRAHV